MPIEGNTNNREIVKNRLIISPNLDALLEQEDKTRAQLASVSDMPSSTLSPRTVSSGDSEEGLIGLPPPPRHPRVKLPRSTTRAAKAKLILDTDLQPRGPTAKPAKPAPTILVESPLSRSSSVSNPFINPAPTLAQLHNIQRSREPSNLQIPELSSLRSESHDGSESPSPSPIVFSSPWSAVDVDAPSRNTSYRHRQQYSVDSHNKPWRVLHGNSHAKRPSTSPGHSPISPTSQPTYAPKKQSSISISSTVYPPSDKESYSYNDPAPNNSENNHSLSHSISMDCPQISPIRFSRRLSDSWPSLYSNMSLSSSKPDLPTTLEPISYGTSMNPEISRPLPRPLPPIPMASRAPLAPTTNFLDSGERADLVRKTRKLARVFGKTPGPDDMPVPELSLSMSRNSSDSDWSRSPASQSDEVRRHSAPLSPDDVYSMSSHGSLPSPKDKAGHHVLNDTFDGGDTASVIKRLPTIPTQSQSETMLDERLDEDEQAEERRRKREKLAKLHRFLGSRVPINLVLGTDIEPTLPSPYLNPIGPLYRNEDGQAAWLKRRRSSSAIPFSPHWSNDLERVKEELNDQEKFINVRRAVKMEKVFGVAPPQTLYHTRHCSSPVLPANKMAPSEGPSPTGSAQRTSKRSTYLKQKSKKNSRPSTADSDMHLVPKVQEPSDDFANPWGVSHSNIYNSYQFSLDSLQDILAWDDRESLVELHQYLNTEEVGPSSPAEVSSLATGNRVSSASFFGRRRSLPVLSSRMSLDSEYSVTLPETNDDTGSGFQVRRRKAAKLTQFFGVDYRELINDVLQSIEHGVKNEHKSGTLRAEEAEDLLARLRKLKIKRPKSQSFLFLD